MFDLVSLLMMQNGATMTVGDSVTFDQPAARGDDAIPGIDAVNFYTSFANPAVEWYSWTAEKPDALEDFVAGNVAYFLGYYYQLETIKDRGGQLDFDIAPVPQVSSDPQAAVNVANYWLESVSVNSAYPDASWTFVQALTTNEQNVTAILTSNAQPDALRTIISTNKPVMTSPSRVANKP